MKKLCDFLAVTPLFQNLNHAVYGDYCERTNIHLFWKGELVTREGDVCPGVGVIIEGQVAKQKYSPGGDSSTLALLGPGDTFGEDLVFAENRQHNYNLEAVSATKIVYVQREDILEMVGRSPRMLSNFLMLLSNKLQVQNQRIFILSQRTLRQKISCYLLELLRRQLLEEGQTLADASRIVSTQAVELPVSKEVVARLLAMPRPSFSRELIAMEKDGMIRVSGRVIWLTDLAALESGVIEDYAS